MIAEDLSKSYGNRVLFRHLSFQIEKGLVLIEGPSGCGKSTLLNILMGIEKSDSGRVVAPTVFSYSGQESSFFYQRSLEKNIALFPSVDSERLSELIREFSFEKFFKVPLNQLSGGERQKGEILYCLAKKADVYYLDEPFSHLDKGTKERLVCILNRFCEDHLVFLINHEENITSLNPSMRIVFGSGKAEVITLKDGETEKTTEKKTFHSPFRPFLAFSYLIRSNPLSLGFQILLLFAFALLFALGTAFVNPSDRYSNYAVSLQADPFSYHTLLGTEETKVDSSFKEEVIDQASYRSLYLFSNDINRGGSYFIDTQENSDSVLYFYTSRTDSLFEEGDSLTLKTEDETFQYVVKSLSKDDVLLSAHKDIRLVQEAIDGKEDQPIALVNRRFVDAVLSYDTSCLSFSDSSLSLEFLFDFQLDGDTLKQSSLSETTIVDGEGFSLALPGKRENSRIKVGSSYVYTSEDGSSLSAPKMSREAAIDILFLTGESYQSTVRLSPYFKDEPILKACEKYRLFIPNVIQDYTQNNHKGILYFVLSGLSLLFLILFRFLSFKGEKRSLVSLQKIFAYRQLSPKGTKMGILLFEGGKLMFPILLSTILYFVLFLPFANETMMKEAYPNPPVGYYYYSMEPQNAYYDNIASPLPFLSFNPLILLLLATFFLFLVLFYLQDRGLMKKNKCFFDIK